MKFHPPLHGGNLDSPSITVDNHVDQTIRLLLLTPVSSFGPLDTVTIEMATSAGQPAVTNQVSNQVMTNPNVTTTNHSMVNTSINQSKCERIHN